MMIAWSYRVIFAARRFASRRPRLPILYAPGPPGSTTLARGVVLSSLSFHATFAHCTHSGSRLRKLAQRHIVIEVTAQCAALTHFAKVAAVAHLDGHTSCQRQNSARTHFRRWNMAGVERTSSARMETCRCTDRTAFMGAQPTHRTVQDSHTSAFRVLQ